MSKSIKNEQLGMNYSTASNRLVKDILFNFIVVCRQNKCFRCSEPMRDIISLLNIKYHGYIQKTLKKPFLI